MLNIPEPIKALFKADSVHKNFRVHFPNGELPDITNDHVVKESVRFTESLCSQNVFKFGLAEASVLEFETVGVANMYGMTIEAGMEIDTSSLTAAQLAAIAADPGDGVLADVSDSDTGYGYYRVPYGVFRVESCPRNHRSMTRRKVTAYSLTSGGGLSPFEAAKAALSLPANKGGPDAAMRGDLLALSLLGWDAPMFLLKLGFTKSQIDLGGTGTSMGVPTRSTTETITKTYKTAEGADYVLGWRYTYSVGPWSSNGYQIVYQAQRNKLYSVELHGVDYAQTIAAAAEYLRNTDIDLAQSGFESWEALAADAFTETTKRGSSRSRLFPGFYYSGYGFVSFAGDNYAVYPNRGAGESAWGYFFVPFYFAIVDENATAPQQLTVLLDVADNKATVYEYSADSERLALTLSISPTGQEGSQIDPLYTFVDAFSAAGIIAGWLELGAFFGRAARDGSYDILALSSASSMRITPDKYEEIWWDEYDVSPIGTVTVTYGSEGSGEATADVSIGDGESVYDMTDNEVLRNIADQDVDSIAELLSGDFADNAANVGFTPVELTMQGWPWIEAGDALEIEAEDGTLVDTYAMRVELSGIQRLTAYIESRGGEIVGEV